MEIRKVCKNVWFDQDNGKFFCELCGKATFDTRAQAIGHLSVCKGKDAKCYVGASVVENDRNIASEVVVPVVVPVVVADGGSQVGLNNFTGGIPPQLDQQREIAVLKQEVASLKQSLVMYTNEVPHMQAVQRYNSSDWFSSNKEIVIVGIAVSVLFLLLRDSKQCSCEVLGKRNTSIGKSIAEKGVSKIMDKTIDRIFK